MCKVAFVFPGQGAQYTGMGKELFDNFKIVRETFEEASDTLHYDMKKLCFDDSDDSLNLTENTQPAILTVSYAALRVVENEYGSCHITTGLSLGEYTSLLCSEALSFEKAVALVKKRGAFMQNAVPEGVGGMSAVIGLSREEINKLVDEAKVKGKIEAANYNCNLQIVVAGEIAALDYFHKIAEERGARKVVRLSTSAPFHTSMLHEAAVKLSYELSNIEFKPFKIPMVTAVTGKLMEEEKLRETLARQVESPVLFEDAINFMIKDGVDTFVEIGPSKVLTGFIKKTDRKLKALNVEDIKSLNKLLGK